MVEASENWSASGLFPSSFNGGERRQEGKTLMSKYANLVEIHLGPGDTCTWLYDAGLRKLCPNEKSKPKTQRIQLLPQRPTLRSRLHPRRSTHPHGPNAYRPASLILTDDNHNPVGMARSIQSSPHCSMHVLESFYAYSICS